MWMRCYMNKNTTINNHNLQLTNEEYDVYTYLNEFYPDLINHFKQYILIGRDKISQRLITSLYRENLIHAKDNSQIIRPNKLTVSMFSKDKDVLCIHFPKSNIDIYSQIKGRYAFDRVDVEGPFYILKHHNHEYERIQHPNDILDLILAEEPKLDNAASEQFREDLNNSAANMILALSYQAKHMHSNYESLWELIAKSDDSYLRSEQSVIEGHPLHPGAKLRKGMSAKENIHYSSEYGQEIQLKCVFIHNSIANVQSLSSTYNDMLQQSFHKLFTHLLNKYNDIRIEDYHLMVVHPWQFEHILLSQYQQELDEQLIIPIDMTLPYYAGLSFRTLMPKYPKLFPHIKLSTNVHITGEIRTLSEQTTHNGPLVTKIVNDILKNDTDFQPYRIETLDEIAGIHFYNSKDHSTIQTERSEQLGTLFRENIYTLIEEDTIPVIPSSLVAYYPNNTEPPIESLIKRYQHTHQFKTFEKAAYAWIQDYATQLLGLVIPLYVKYGIALEAHLQNSIATFNQDGCLSKIYIRDFEGLRIDETQLNQMGYKTSHFHKKSRILTQSTTSVFNKVFYSTVQNHLAELILTITEKVENINFEKIMWHHISHIIQDILAKLTDVDTERMQKITHTLFAATIDYKCVTTMRLEDEAHHYTYIKVNNPLH